MSFDGHVISQRYWTVSMVISTKMPETWFVTDEPTEKFP